MEIDVAATLKRVDDAWRDRLGASLGSYQASLDLAQPLSLSAAYTPLQISWNLSHQRWLEVTDLEETANADASPPSHSDISAISARDDLASRDRTVILGKPGSGKTTLLRHLALSCAAGDFRGDRLPIFIELRHWAATLQASDQEIKPLQEFIQESWALVQISPIETEAILQAGQALVLLDGLDEVATAQFESVVQGIQQFAAHYYHVPITVTCRTAADRIRFQGFAYGELRDFDWHQVKTFAQRWFTAIAPSRATNDSAQSNDMAADFLDRLEQRENQAIRELVKTPILLGLVCSVFHARATFPTQRSKLYKAGLNILLDQWDSARGIHRESRYRKLTNADKMRLLGQIAATQFEAGRSFFEKSEVLAIICDFLTVMDTAAGKFGNGRGDRSQNWENRWADAETILMDIVVQHGLLVECARDIYAFSHLTFQEYLTARKWVAALSACESQIVALDHPEQSRTQSPADRLATRLAERVFTPRWRETIGLVVEMLPRSDSLLIALKSEVDRAVMMSSRVQDILRNLADKVSAPELEELPIKPAALRAFYLTLFQNRDLNLAIAVDPQIASFLPDPVALDLALARVYSAARQLLAQPNLKGMLSLNFALDLDGQFTLAADFQQAIAQLKHQLPSPELGRDALLEWCKTDLSHWCRELQDCLQEHRLLIADWQLAPQEVQMLEDYYQANEFLTGCLANGQVSQEVQATIESELLLPLSPPKGSPKRQDPAGISIAS
ncbi:MAG: NACHT domain-containing protein [Cyanobacteria bacterium P01_D01_bin.73]